jgi:hypothetical protein
MAIHDLLWACPVCKTCHAIRPAGREATCSACSARLSREPDARIRVTAVDSTEAVHSAVDWEATLPPIDEIPAGGTLGPEAIRLRIGQPARPVRARGKLIGWAEDFGPIIDATMTLDADHIAIQTAAGVRHEWPLEDLTAVQPSSSALQINTRDTLLSIRFLVGSVRRWEALLCRLIRERAHAVGRGSVTHFQPRIRYG